jgi:signal transduction histidine kinase
MPSDTPNARIDRVGDVATWGAHIALFYETKDDLLDTLVPYCRTGLERNESCLWFVAEPYLTTAEAWQALRSAVDGVDRYKADGRIEIDSANEWFARAGSVFDGDQVAAAWYEKLASVSSIGRAGLRITGDAGWVDRNNWDALVKWEDRINDVIRNQHAVVVCSYPLAATGVLEILDAVRTHQFAFVRRRGSWEVFETAGLKQAKAELKRLNTELEKRVEERTREFIRASDSLREAQMHLAHVNRVTTMGQLAASISHEVMQPIASAIANAQAALNFLDSKPPELSEARDALGGVVADGNRACEIMSRIRDLFKKAPPRKDAVYVNETILEVIKLAHGEALKNGVSVKTQLANDLPLVRGDRVQLQQVVLNLIINAVEAMIGVSEGSRDLLISSDKDATGGVLVSVQDSGPRLPPDSFDRFFDAFYTTKIGGTGMGLSISRSIIEQHGGRIWASSGPHQGAIVRFTLPIDGCVQAGA